jgi:hypothetical protein
MALVRSVTRNLAVSSAAVDAAEQQMIATATTQNVPPPAPRSAVDLVAESLEIAEAMTANALKGKTGAGAEEILLHLAEDTASMSASVAGFFPCVF